MQNAGFNIMFTLNGNYIGNMFVTGDMMFAAAITNLYQYHPYLSQYQPTFYVNSNEVKADSCKKLIELGLQNMSTIEVRTMNVGMPPNPMPQNPMPQNPVNKPGNKAEDGFLNIAFFVEGRTINVLGTKNDKFSEISKKFCTKADTKDRIPSYLLQSTMIGADDNRTLNELNIQNNQRIEVVFTQSVIGAYY